MSLYSELGGQPAVGAAVDIFYKKVLADPDVNYFFDGLIMSRQKKMLEHFLIFAFGGPNNYSGRGMRAAHQRQVEYGLNDKHYNRIIDHLGSTLKELGVTDTKIKEAAAVANSVRGDVLNH
ncbi:group I truncated hemoglobin [Aurantivibrio plasticivorans]